MKLIFKETIFEQEEKKLLMLAVFFTAEELQVLSNLEEYRRAEVSERHLYFYIFLICLLSKYIAATFFNIPCSSANFAEEHYLH